MSEIDYLDMIYQLLLQYQSAINLFVGFIQFLIVVFVLVVIYKLFNLFF